MFDEDKFMTLVADKEIGIYGGSFNPPTIGHEGIIRTLTKPYKIGTNPAYMLFDEIWIVCSYNHPFNKDLIDHEDRRKMCELAFKQYKNVKVTEYKDSGTYELIKKIQEEHTDCKFTFIMGEDCVKTFHLWKNYEELKKLIPFLVLNRKGVEHKDENWFSYIKDSDVENISSTYVRNNINSKDVQKYLNPEVYSLIKERGFYE